MTNTISKTGLEGWKDYIGNADHDPKKLAAILSDDVVFYSPVVHTPQEGKDITMMYLMGAAAVLGNDDFKYVGEWLSANGAVLEFKTVIDGIEIDGIDMITWNEQGLITEFKVMVRPLKAMNMLHTNMKAMLESLAK